MNAAQTPLISVILPAYNVGAYIGAAISSLKDQTLVDFQALVIDDGSTDDTAQNARAAIADDPRFRLISQKNKGLSGARNAGLDAADTPFIAFLDGDDRYDPQFLETLSQDLIASGAEWAACAVTFCTKDGATHPHSAIHGNPVPHPSPLAQDVSLADWKDVICHFPSAWNKLYRRDFIGDLRFDEGTWYEDHTFFQRLAARTDRLRYIPRPLYLYTLERDGQITRADSERVFEQFAVLETSVEILRSSPKCGAETALARLATRLFNERLDTIGSPERSARFLAKTAAFFARHKLRPDWRWDSSLNVMRSFSLSGAPLVTIRVARDDCPTPDGLLPPKTAPFAQMFGVAAWSDPVPDDGLVLDLPSPMRLDHDTIVSMGERLLRSDCAALVAPLALWRPEHEASPPEPLAGLVADGPARLDPERVVELGMTDHVMLAKATHALAFANPPDVHLVRQAYHLSQSSAQVLWCPIPFAPEWTIPQTVSFSDYLKRLDDFAANLGPVPRPMGWDRRLFLRHATQVITAMQQEQNPFRRRRRLLVPMAQLWQIGRKRRWIGTPGAVDRQTAPLLCRIFHLPPIP